MRPSEYEITRAMRTNRPLWKISRRHCGRLTTGQQQTLDCSKPLRSSAKTVK
jgi:hypothetical protein